MKLDEKIEKLVDVALDMFMYENGDDVARAENERRLTERFRKILRPSRRSVE